MRRFELTDEQYKRLLQLFSGKPGRADVNFHSLRHTCASWLVMKNVPLRRRSSATARHR